MPDEPKTVFLHVGCRKSGTTALQLGLRRSVDRLEGAGLAQPLLGRRRSLHRLVLPLRGAAEGREAEARRAVEQLARRIRTSEHPRQLVSIEALAELPAGTAALVVEGLAEFDTRLVVTARPWALTIPSEWQQRVKERFTGDYLAYTRAVRAAADPGARRDEEAERFRRRHDLADVVQRWRSSDPDLPVTVILVPSDRGARPDLHELFCQVLGIDPHVLRMPRRRRNPSLGREDAEVLRRLNVALGDRLREVEYRYSVRKWIGVRTMMKRSRGSRIRFPRELEGWASAESGRQLAELEELGCELLGDRSTFVAPPLPQDDYQPVTDAEVAEASVAVLADLAHGRARARRRSLKRARRHRRDHPGGRVASSTGLSRRVSRRIASAVLRALPVPRR